MEIFEKLCTRFINIGPLVLRLGLGCVFAYFSFHKLSADAAGVAEIEQMFSFVGHGTAALANYYTGLFEGFAALSLFFGFYVRIFAALEGLMITTIIAAFLINGFINDAVYRDLGLVGAAFCLMFTGAGSISVDAYMRKKKTGQLPRLAIVGALTSAEEQTKKEEKKIDSDTPFAMPPSKLSM
jgi:uncharacterized membrane protein YphA (DoxX/SURF4 family)